MPNRLYHCTTVEWLRLVGMVAETCRLPQHFEFVKLTVHLLQDLWPQLNH